MKREFSQQIFEKSSNIKFHENPSSRSRDVPFGRTDTEKLIIVLRDFANAPKTRKFIQAISDNNPATTAALLLLLLLILLLLLQKVDVLKASKC
jgi:hypothetical protein